MQNYITQADNAPVNVDFFAHYKLLFKMCQMSLTTKRMTGFERKQAKSDESISEIQTQMETYQAISKNLDFHKELTNEADRMRTCEIALMQKKHDSLKGEMTAMEKDFVAEYFASLFSQ